MHAVVPSFALLLLAACGEPEPCEPPACQDTGCACEDCSDSEPPEDSDPPDDTGEPPPPPLLIALYDDTDETVPGAWDPGLDAIEAAITAAGHHVQRIHRRELNEQAGLLHGYDALLFGGGFAYPGYTRLITERGKARIQEFVASGGAYVGICAGSYFVCDQLDYEGDTWDDESGYDTELYPSVCGGPVHEVSSYPVWAPATIDLPGHPAYDQLEGPTQRQLYYAGGPFFPEPPAEAEILATYADEGPHQGLAAVITMPYGLGRVVLWGPHPELLEVEEQPEISLDPGNRELYAAVVQWAAGGPR
jgi:glutamine amidotransferase-like uncharacterized protein